MFGSVGTPELIVILVIAMIVFGPGKLPELGNTIGKAIRDFKKEMNAPQKKLDMPESGKSEGKQE
ncbi:MAG: twin-arginine translocase TatA/TatE family subunit [Syntrophales bacterium]